ncbi:MAG: hypothetical protein DRH90_09855 [Deltaproteobacteria bacterium]|nr:MAG: hypothetical protein DRH90_09855 [Deltaproteobacteria bacterium]RLC16918.1 MAG: hypothetical protein DRI24_07175 [Deltaproteobacteria bacterium]
MDNSRHTPLIVLLLILWIPLAAVAMTGEQVLRLKQAGVSDESIQLMIQEKSIETVSLTIQEVVDMKAAGIGEDTLQLMIRGLSFMKDNQPVVYESPSKGLRITSASDLLMLKEAGFSDETIRAIVTVASEDEDQQNYEQARRILERLNLWVSPSHRRPLKQRR